MNLLTRFLLTCSGARPAILEECPTDRTLYVSIGGTIFFTGLFATLSSSNAFYHAFRAQLPPASAPYIAVAFGVLWGLMIFNLDRFIVFSMSTRTGAKSGQLLMAIPRFLIAVLVSISIATPLETAILASRIRLALSEFSVRTLESETSQAHNHALEARQAVDSLDARMEHIRSLAREDTPAIAELRRAYHSQLDAYTDLKEAALSQLVTLRKDEASIISDEEQQQGQSSGSTGERSPYTSEKLRDTRAAIASINSELAREWGRCEALRENLESKETEYQRQLEDEAHVVATRRIVGENQRAEADSTYRGVRREADTAIRQNVVNDLVNELEGLHQLHADPRSVARWISIFITLLFCLVECSPIIVKLLAPRGPYELIVEREQSSEVERAEGRIARDASLASQLRTQSAENAGLLICSFFEALRPIRTERMVALVEDWKVGQMNYAELLRAFQSELLEYESDATVPAEGAGSLARLLQRVKQGILARDPHGYRWMVIWVLAVTVACFFATKRNLGAIAIGNLCYLLTDLWRRRGRKVVTVELQP